MNEKTSKKCYKLEVHLERGAEEFLPEDIYHYARNGLWIEDKGYSSIIKCYPENIELFLNTLKDSGLKIKDLSIEEEDVPDYNELTKRYFKSIKVSGVRIVPPWAKNIPNGAIIIDPGMAFGTGRHESTKIMIKLMQKIDFKEREVIDIGCGSAILAIYASMLGAKSVLAIDNDFDAVISAKKNINLNRRENIKVVCADVNDIKGSFDIVLANLDIRTFQKNKNKL
ncbi:MAG: 50S ribosomal protein L11 methyltransferase, partial [Syntrophorhabdaceae bacterium]|nr:50S ribosomal protein L11 methyltransferase [Syntrophorhabdaceae bacterium]